jgi:D-alanyl-D-alanine-carboxypeptidase/D-alanyl-D-alanine-endopeptidase
MNTVGRVICFTLLLSAFSFRAAAEEFTNAIAAYLQQCVHAEIPNGCIVVGMVDENGSSVVSCGKLENGTDQEVNGDTVFAIRSMTVAFTGLLLQDMIERAQMKLDDPVAMYLPKSVKMPIYHGKEITLRHLAAETSGLLRPDDGYLDSDPRRADNPLADFTIEKMYAYLSGYKLTQAPGAKRVHGGVQMGLLGHAIALKAGTNYESLVVNRICRPLKMDSTRFTLTPDLKSRLAIGHSQLGYAMPTLDWGAQMPLGGLNSTADDLLKFVSANLGLLPSSLTPLMEKNMTNLGFASRGGGIVWFNGGGHYRSYAGFDKTRRRGVVVLSNSDGFIDAISLGNFLLETEWQSDRRPMETKISNPVYGSLSGQYRPASDATPRKFRLWPFSHHKDAASQSGIGIRCEGDRLFAQATGSNSWPADAFLPPIAGELLPESDTRFFERLSGTPITFSRNAQGKVTGLTANCRGNVFSFKKISDQPPKAPETFKPRVAIKLDTKLLDACVGHYEFTPNAVCIPNGMKVTIWREGDQLVWQAWGKGATRGAFDIYPESETNFFIKINPGDTQLTFIKNDKGEMTAVIHHEAGLPDIEGRKLK